MAKTRGGFTFNTGRQPLRRAQEFTVAPRETRRLNRNLQKIVSDLGASSKKMKRHGQSSKGKTVASVSIPDSPPPVPKLLGTALSFRSSKFATRFQNWMVNKSIVYGKPVEPVLFQKIGVIALFEKVGLSAMLFLPKSAYPILIKQFFGNMSVSSDRIDSFVQDKYISIDLLFWVPYLTYPVLVRVPLPLKGQLKLKT